MQRLVEQPTEDGDVFDGPVCIGRVHYHLCVYQHFAEDDESVPAQLDVEGRLMPFGGLDLIDAHRRGPELTLRLADGRTLDFSVVDGDGRIRSTGRGALSGIAVTRAAVCDPIGCQHTRSLASTRRRPHAGGIFTSSQDLDVREVCDEGIETGFWLQLGRQRVRPSSLLHQSAQVGLRSGSTRDFRIARNGRRRPRPPVVSPRSQSFQPRRRIQRSPHHDQHHSGDEHPQPEQNPVFSTGAQASHCEPEDT